MKEYIKKFLAEKGYNKLDLKAVLFDMDGVLYDSMKAHAKSWQQTMEENNLASTPEEFFLHEGRVGSNTIDLIIRRELGRPATEEEKVEIYKRKSQLFTQYNNGEIIPCADKVLDKVKEKGLLPVLVTGSGQKSLLDNLEENFPGIFKADQMVTAYDVTKGKPDPEPYLMGLQKGGDLKPDQAIVVENAPMGVQAAVAAGVFTIAVNTGPIPDEALWDAGANIVLPSMEFLFLNLDNIFAELGA
ncbi:HAD family hydrolase [Dysgonomonas sp. 216]|uniref:HAD family hydrolase n=1 Tax=Dysgonomonas sp. 216 TaxID=2302934 RepID=UPI0013D73AA9|nr:HAD hydrolase-like protein [Dysgonomonas sp. 216]NDW17803.1 HAD family hydrolase [Dysgonomonas sp. 216]